MSTTNASRIIGIQFSILSPAEIRKNSVVEVVSRETYTNNKPSIGGMFDPRMGVLDPGAICPTDGHTYIKSPGYFGHIEMARPVYFIQHLKDIVKVCKCICFKCSKLLINKSKYVHLLDMPSEDRWNEVCNLTANVKRCGDRTDDGCGCKQPSKIKVSGMATIHAIWDITADADAPVDTSADASKTLMKLTPEIVAKIFRRISNDDVAFMGFHPVWSRPEWMICEVLPVPPPAVRPSVKQDAQQRSEDDLTHIYNNIIKNNNILHDKLNAPDTPAKIVDDWTDILQHSVAMIVNNNIKGVSPLMQHRSTRKLQCITGRLNTKAGRIRWNLMGKRVDYSARSVITGDPNLSILQLGVPMKIAMNVTRPVTVNSRNRAFLTTLVLNGPDVYPGAKILEKRGNDTPISLRYIDKLSITLDEGDIVHRHLMDGDAVLFNRQPSLHRMSMMCHIAKIMAQGDTFRMNVGDTEPYNADFDGDEMNAHIAQNMLADVELREIAAIQYQMISPRKNQPIIGIFQDSMLGTYLFTRKNVSFTSREAMNLLMSHDRVDVDELRANASSDHRLTNFSVLSQIVPPMTIVRKTGVFKDDEDYATTNNVLEIRNGKYIRGRLIKNEIMDMTHGLLHRICNDFGNMECVRFNDGLQNIVTEYMKTTSFSVGISDLKTNARTQREILTVLADQKSQVNEIIESVHLNVFRNETSSSNGVEFEMRVLNALNDATNKAGQVGISSLDSANRFIQIVDSGSKGAKVNISQMVSCIGQQNLEGKRIPYGFDARTLPHFSKYDDSPAARGFIENSYISGLNSAELFFHAMAGRIGLIDTACKTSVTGYIQRRIVKGLEDLKMEYDMTVRNSMGKIIQYSYGEDGFDSIKVEKQKIPLVKMSIEDIYMRYDLTDISATSDKLSIYAKPAITRMRKQTADLTAKCATYIDKLITARDALIERVFKNTDADTVFMPVCFEYLIDNVKGQFHLNAGSLVDITPLETFELIEFYHTKLNANYFHKTTALFDVLYYYYLSPKILLVSHRMHRKALTVLLETIVLKFREAMIHPGECVGIIAAQSLGEPATQLTLNTFHHSGVAGKANSIAGVPRIEEILRLTSNGKSPSLTVYLNDDNDMNKEKVQAFANVLVYTCLADVVDGVQIYFDPNDNNTVVEADRQLMEQYREFNALISKCAGDVPAANQSPWSKWVVRLAMSKEKLLDKGITMDDVHFAVTNSTYGINIECTFSDYNADNLVFRIRVNSSVFSKGKRKNATDPETLDLLDEIYLLKSFQDALLNNIVLRGVPGITAATIRKLPDTVRKEEPVRKQDGKFVKKESWVLDTDGANLLKTLALDGVDSRRTVSTDIRKVFDVLGIEAARNMIHSEFMSVMGGTYINYHHISLLCDRMTCNKNMIPMFRSGKGAKSGLLSDNTGTLAKASFESHAEVLMAAARHGHLDPMRGVSASVFVGDTGFYGTSAFSLVIDLELMAAQGERTAKLRDEAKEVEAAFIAAAPDVGECARSEIEMVTHAGATKAAASVCQDEYDMGF